MLIRLVFLAALCGAALSQDAAPVAAADTPVVAAPTDAAVVASAPASSTDAPAVASAPVTPEPSPAPTIAATTPSASNPDGATCPFFQPTTTGTSPGRTPYEMLTAQSKLDYIWSQLLTNQFTGPTNDPQLVFSESMDPTVHFQSDFIPKNRLKVTHSSGVVCKVKLEINQNVSPYTGLLNTGSDYGLLRWSSVVDPFIVGGPVPSMAVKFFKDGELSANGVALNTQVVQRTSNPLALPMTNQFVAAPLNIQQKFGTVTGYPNFTGNSALAYDRSNSSAKINFPWQLIWVPNPAMQQLFPEHWQYRNNAEYYSQFLAPNFNMPSGDPILFHLHAVDKPGDMSFYLGDLRMKSPFFRSEFGDKVLFFKHTTTEEDIHFRPEFGAMCPPRKFQGCSPCPQTYNCVNSDWANQINRQSPYSEVYNPRNFATNSESSKIIEDIFTIGTDAFIQKYGYDGNPTEIVEHNMTDSNPGYPSGGDMSSSGSSAPMESSTASSGYEGDSASSGSGTPAPESSSGSTDGYNNGSEGESSSSGSSESYPEDTASSGESSGYPAESSSAPDAYAAGSDEASSTN